MTEAIQTAITVPRIGGPDEVLTEDQIRGCYQVGALANRYRAMTVLNPAWWDPSTFIDTGTIAAERIGEVSDWILDHTRRRADQPRCRRTRSHADPQRGVPELRWSAFPAATSTYFGHLRPRADRGLSLGDLAHSTHLRGAGTYDGVHGERDRVTVTVATVIPEDVTCSVNLDFLDPATIDATG